jgi:RNA polymerase sigma-70 factor (ECF subfamily)
VSAEARYLDPEVPDELSGDYRRTFERLRGHFRVRGVSSEEAADLAQEAALRAYLHVRRRGATTDNLVPLLNQIARNLLIDRHRRGGPRTVPLEETEPAADTASDPTDTIIALEAHRAVREALAALPERHRDALLMALEGMTPAEVGERMGIGRNAADALLHRARRSLKDRLRVVHDVALGFAIAGYIRVRYSRRALEVGEPALAGAIQTVGTAAAALVIALNIGSPAQPAAAGQLSGVAGASRIVATGPHVAGTRSIAAGGAAAGSGYGASGGFFQLGSTGGGGLSDHGTTHVAVKDGNDGPTVLGVDLYGYTDPTSPGTVESLAQSAARSAAAHAKSRG